MLEKLFTSKSRVKIIGYLFFEEEVANIREIARGLMLPVSSIKREIDNLIDIGILKKDRGIKINEKCIICKELKEIFIKTDYFVEPLKKVLDGKKIKFAFIFGSFAKGNWHGESDVDLMILGDIKLSEVIKILKSVEGEIKRDINPVVWKMVEFEKKKQGHFFKEVFSKKLRMLIGDEDELRRIVKR